MRDPPSRARCGQRCNVATGEQATAECPHRDPDHLCGMTQHVTMAFIHPDGFSHARLARLFACGSPPGRRAAAVAATPPKAATASSRPCASSASGPTASRAPPTSLPSISSSTSARSVAWFAKRRPAGLAAPFSPRRQQTITSPEGVTPCHKPLLSLLCGPLSPVLAASSSVFSL